MPQNMLDLALANPGLTATFAYVLYAMLYGAVLARDNARRRKVIAVRNRLNRALPQGATGFVATPPSRFIRLWPDTLVRITLAGVIVWDIARLIL